MKTTEERIAAADPRTLTTRKIPRMRTTCFSKETTHTKVRKKTKVLMTTEVMEVDDTVAAAETAVKDTTGTVQADTALEIHRTRDSIISAVADLDQDHSLVRSNLITMAGTSKETRQIFSVEIKADPAATLAVILMIAGTSIDLTTTPEDQTTTTEGIEITM